MSVNVVYWWIDAHRAGETRHPQTFVESLGCKVLKYEAFGISDCSLMRLDKLPEKLPGFIKVTETARFSDE